MKKKREKREDERRRREICSTYRLLPASFPSPSLRTASKQMPLVSSSTSSAARKESAAAAAASAPSQPPLPPPPHPAPSSTVLSLSSLLGSRSSARSFARALRVSRLFLVLDVAHEALSRGKTVTNRDLWYRLKGAGAARAPAEASAAVADAQTLLALPREALGLRAAPRGAVAGCLWIADAAAEEEGGGGGGGGGGGRGGGNGWTDLRRVGPAGFALPGCPAAARALRVASDAAFLVVVEKDAAFERLVEDRVWEGIRGGAVLATARGMPDLATRAFCSHLLSSSSSSGASSPSAPASASAPPLSMRVLGLCDWNPGGVAILTIYKNGSFVAAAAANAAANAPAAAATNGAAAASPSPTSSSLSARALLEGAAYALPSLRWLGARSSWLLAAGTRDEALQPLTARDLGTARSLAGALSSAAAACGAADGGGGGGGEISAAGDFSSPHPWVRELEAMAAAGVKAELEAVEDGEGGTVLGTLSAVVAEAVNAGDWI